MSQGRINTDLLDSLVTGRVEPHIYAFTTQTVPNYLKVGDTYRPLKTRLDEWRRRFPNLRHVYSHSARIDDNTIFRDYSVHEFLECVKSRPHLKPDDLPNLSYYSKEFFKNATKEDVGEAIDDINKSAKKNDGRYTFYSSDHLPKTYTYTRGESYQPRDNQQEVIDNFIKAIKLGRKNLLMFAVMRFGKSFTSLCCAKEIDANLVLVVSAKADVKDEWKKTVESIGNFDGYIFLEKADLLRGETVIGNSLDKGEKVVLFLTLQDLQGDTLKEEHLEVFSLDWDLLIVDETHFGARAEHYGKLLLTKKEASAESARQMKDVDTLDKLDTTLKELRTLVTIHLSGTPYRILMGSEFEREDIISFVQFSDIAEAQSQWIEEHRYDEDIQEWDNPYYGFPQMIRFAFMPNKSSLERIEQLRASGASSSFSELFKPRSLSASKDGYDKFFHEDVVLDFLKVIDGIKNDSNVLGFLDNDRIKEGKLCRHIVFVLPYCASCDAMESLIKTKADEFRHLSEYEIVNISGVRRDKRFDKTSDVKQFIANCEIEGKRTITLTVNRMLTGNTVPQWDTMLFLKQSSSPEEYDQAIFRLQNPFIDEYECDGRVIKFNMKPQTILVDFDPDRVFRLQERKSQIYNVNIDNNGNSRLLDRIDSELKISPIITLDHNKLREVTSSNIIDSVRRYSETRSVLEEASDMPIDLSLLDNPEFFNIVNSLNEINSKKGLTIPVNSADNEDSKSDVDSKVSDKDKKEDSSKDTENPDKDVSEESKGIAKKFAAYYALILFYAFLTDEKVSSLEEIIKVLDSSDENKRIYRNLGLDPEILKFIQNQCDGFALSRLDYKIQNTNSLNHDDSKTPLEKVKIALTKFGRMSDSEIVTPMEVADKMVNMLPDDVFEKGPVLDIAAKQGEFAVALLKRYSGDVSDKIYSVCTSKLAYEFTRKVYKLLSMPTNHIFESFTSYDLIKRDENKNFIIPQEIKDMNFSSIIGNPPYQDEGGSGGTNDASIYQDFCQWSFSVNPLYTTMVIPSRWFTGGRENLVGPFRKQMLTSRHIPMMTAYTNAKDLFPNTEIKGGCCYFTYSTSYRSNCDYTLIRDNKDYKRMRNLGDFDILIREPILSDIVSKIVKKSNKFVERIISSDTPFGIPTNPGLNSKTSITTYPTLDSDHDTQLYLIKRTGRCKEFVSIKEIKKNVQDIMRPKVLIPEAYGAGETFPHQILGQPILASAKSVCSQSYLYAAFDTDIEAKSFYRYLRTKFLRALVSSSKISQHAMNKVYRFVPTQDFTENSDIDWSKSIEEIDAQLYAKYGLNDKEIEFIESMIKPM